MKSHKSKTDNSSRKEKNSGHSHVRTAASLADLPHELIHLENIVGEFMQYWGFKKIHGRIWTHLYTSQVALDTEQLMERLQVSKGLMSLAMRDLLHYKVIEETFTGKHGTVFYKANDDLQSVIFNVLKTRERVMLSQTQNTLEKILKLKDSTFEKHQMNRERVQSVLDLTTSSLGLLNYFLQNTDCQNTQLFDELNPDKA